MSQARKEAYLKFKAMRANFDQLVKGTSPDITNIALQCFAKSLISQAMVRAGTPEILSTILSRVSTDLKGYAFDTFCHILEEESSTEYLADELKRKLDMLRKASKRRKPPHHNSNKSESVINLTPEESYDESDQDEVNSNSSFTSDKNHSNDAWKSSSESDDEEDDDENTSTVDLGRFKSVNHPEFPGYRRNSPSPFKSNNCSRSTSPNITQIFEHLTLEEREHSSCAHVREIEKLRKDTKNLKKTYREKLNNLRARHHLKLKMMKWERRQQMQKMKYKLYQLRDSLVDSRAREEKLSTELRYLEMECFEVHSQRSQLQQMLQVSCELYACRVGIVVSI